jgi:hypothetical protein
LPSDTPGPDQRLSPNFRLVGLLPLAFFIAQAAHYWRIGELGHMLWMCNIGNLILALGIFMNRPVLIRVAVLWMIPGLVVWFVYVVLAWGVFLTSTLAHVGGFIVGIVAIQRVGMDRESWFYALLWYFAVQLLSRVLTPSDLNVNVSHKIYEGWQQTFGVYWKFWVVLTICTATILWILALVLRTLWPARQSLSLTQASGT